MTHNKIKIHNARQRMQKLHKHVALLHSDIAAHIETKDGLHKDRFQTASFLISEARMQLEKAIEKLT